MRSRSSGGHNKAMQRERQRAVQRPQELAARRVRRGDRSQPASHRLDQEEPPRRTDRHRHRGPARRLPEPQPHEAKEDRMSAFNAQQTLQLLAPIKTNRVLRDPKGHSHVSQQDITAHLIRVFGFGSFDTDIVKVECIFEENAVDRKTGEVKPDRWDVCYRALLRLTIRDADGNEVCHYEDGSTATAQNQTRGDAHDLAYKSALSLAKKRAAINLGDQFGLSLYNKGQTDALVRGTLVLPAKPEGDEKPSGDVQDGVAQQVSLGNDEIDREQDSEHVA